LNDEHFGNKITHARDHLAYLKASPDSNRNEDRLILELGTGWYPIVPLAFYLSDAGKVTSLDIQNWLTKDGFLTTIRKLEEWKMAGKLDLFIPDLNPQKWNSLLALLKNEQDYELAQLCSAIGFTPMLQDARNLDFPANYFDFIVSNNTFEHVFEEVLTDILKEFNRVVKPEGLMSHFIDLSDHFAHFDHSITIYNFLQFSKQRWALIDNTIQPQNRLRWKDYRKIYADLNIPITEETIRSGDLAALATVNIHPEYGTYSSEELAISHGYLVSRLGL
jgi:SAM-dependent methyltransferase